MPNKCTRMDVLSFSEMKTRYDMEYPSYQIDFTAVEKLRPLVKNIGVTIVLGTWCGDCQLQVPRFYKVIDELGISDENIILICVDRTKRDENGETDLLGIEKIPTFIFTQKESAAATNNLNEATSAISFNQPLLTKSPHKGLQEIGRITESPVVTIEEDMIYILSINK